MDTDTPANNPPALDYDDQFPILQHGLYANHAAMAPWPRATQDAVISFAQQNTASGPENYAHWLRQETQLRQMLARLVNAASENDIALLKNTTEGICTVANGIDWHSGDNLVLPTGEFPSNRLPWLALQKLGVEVREVDIRASDEPEQALLDRMDNDTRLLSVSATQWTDGLRLRLDVLGAACQQSGVLFFVDAIQQLGALQVDVQACGIDFLAADSHKWLLGPEGIALFYSRDSARDKLALQQHGWRMADDPYQFNRDDWTASATARRFEAGSPNMLGQVAMHASLTLLQGVGMEQVETRVLANSLALCEGIAALPGLQLLRPFDHQRASGIVSFRMPGTHPAVVQRVLQQRGMVCTVRGDAIRLSPHFYQAGKPLQDMLDLIATVTNNLD